MIRLKLTKRQALELKRVFDQTPDLKLRKRTQILLMFDRGRSRRQIMADVGVCDRTITRWLNIYVDQGLEGLTPYRPTYRFLRGDRSKQAKAAVELAAFKKRQKRRPHPLESGRGEIPHGAYPDNGAGGQRASPGAAYPGQRIVMVVDNAPWHRGKAVNEVLEGHPHLQLYRLPSYSPQLNVIERFWKPLRRRATHNRLFDELTDLKASVRTSIQYFQRTKNRLIGIVQNCYQTKRTVSSGA